MNFDKLFEEVTKDETHQKRLEDEHTLVTKLIKFAHTEGRRSAVLYVSLSQETLEALKKRFNVKTRYDGGIFLGWDISW